MSLAHGWKVLGAPIRWKLETPKRLEKKKENMALECGVSDAKRRDVEITNDNFEETSVPTLMEESHAHFNFEFKQYITTCEL